VLLKLGNALEIRQDGRMPPATARARARAEITREIVDAGKRQLAEVGAAGLSLRAVAREVGMVSSAVYRYFPSREQLITTLIVDAYDGLGAAVEHAEAPVDRDDLRGRWRAAGGAVRAWALAHPHEYALIYGSPVPGYRAPEDTIAPATRAALVLIELLVDAQAQGRLVQDPPTTVADAALRADLELLRDTFRGVPDALILRALVGWSALFGLVSFELFGQFQNVIAANAAFFAVTLNELATFIGIDAAG
jgi:AcrR family transcriptional regulator